MWFLVPCSLSAQFNDHTSVSDTKYLEDQLYIGIHYNLFSTKPDDVFQRNFSYGLQAGVIRDIPLTANGRVALGLGLGYAINSYYSNIIATNTEGVINYQLATSDTDFNRSKLETHSLQVPLELRWRNSTRNRYQFFRLYTGVKLDYNFSNRSKLVASEGKTSFNNTDIENFQYGLTLNLGYSGINVHVYYALNDLMRKGTALNTGEDLSLRPLRIGLIFYIL